MWYDEAEFHGIGGSSQSQGQIVIPYMGQDYMKAAQEFSEIYEGMHLKVTNGSKFRFTYV